MSSKVIPLSLNQVGRDMLRPKGEEEERVQERAIKWENGREERQGKGGESKGRRRMFGGDGGEGKGEKEG